MSTDLCSITEWRIKRIHGKRIREEAAAQNKPHSSVRMLKIEADGDPWLGVKSKIRLIGHWLERAGFKPGHRVQVTCLAPGVIELRSSNSEAVENSAQVQEQG